MSPTPALSLPTLGSCWYASVCKRGVRCARERLCDNDGLRCVCLVFTGDQLPAAAEPTGPSVPAASRAQWRRSWGRSGGHAQGTQLLLLLGRHPAITVQVSQPGQSPPPSSPSTSSSFLQPCLPAYAARLITFTCTCTRLVLLNTGNPGRAPVGVFLSLCGGV
jgi:hypothetical protein